MRDGIYALQVGLAVLLLASAALLSFDLNPFSRRVALVSNDESRPTNEGTSTETLAEALALGTTSTTTTASSEREPHRPQHVGPSQEELSEKYRDDLEELEFLNRNVTRRFNESKCSSPSERTLFVGHSHVMALKTAHCLLATQHSPGGILPRKQMAYSREMPCSPLSWGFGTPYLDIHPLKRVLLRGKSTGGGGFRTGGFGTIILGVYSWDSMWLNSEPSVVYERIKAAMHFLHKEQTSARKQFNIRKRRSGATGDPPTKFIVMLPHYNRRATHGRWIPCMANDRMRIYHKAMEAAAYDFRAALLHNQTMLSSPGSTPTRREGATATDAKQVVKQLLPEVLVMDFYNWSKNLSHGNIKRTKTIDDPWSEDKDFLENSTWADGGDADYMPDGHHLRESRYREVTLALFERGVLCDPNTPKLEGPRGLRAEENSEFLRAPRDMREVYLDEINSGTLREDTGPGPTPKIPSNATDAERAAIKVARLNWPSRPTCESHNYGSDSSFFWGNQQAWLDPAQWPAHPLGLAEMLERNKYPRADVLRYQVVQLVKKMANGFRYRFFSPLRFEVTECLNNVGLTENATKWESGEGEMRGNILYIMWKRTRRRLNAASIFATEADPNATEPLHKRERRRKARLLAETFELPPAPVPTCVCANKTHLLQDIHVALLNQVQLAEGKKGVSAKEAAIAKYCTPVLEGFPLGHK